MQELSGRTAVVTGAGSGIGRALVQRLGREGMRVVAADVEEPALDETVALLLDAGVEAVPVLTDVADAAAVEALADRAYDRFGGVDLVCANAGVFQGGLIWERTAEDWGWVLGVNVWGVINTIHAFVPRMLAAGADGHLVITASMAGIGSTAYSGPYVTSKFAAVALAECLAHDLRAAGAPIGVSVLCPGAVNTRIASSTRNRPTERASEAAAPDAHFVEQALADMTKQGREPDEIAGLVVEAVKAGDFYIPTTPSYPDQLRARVEAMLERRLPGSMAFD